MTVIRDYVGGTASPDFLAADFRTWIQDRAPADLAPLFAAACASRGKRSGRVLASVPSAKGPRVCGAWRALMANLAPNRCGAFALLWADDEEREAFEAADRWLDSDPTALAAVRLAGQGFCEFNLTHTRVSEVAIRDWANGAGIDPTACGVRSEVA